MYILKFFHENKSYFLHDGESFVGGNTAEEAKISSIENTAKSLSVGGFDIVEVTIEKLSDMIGGVPYNITSFKGGLIPFMGVEIKDVKTLQ